VPFVVCLQLLFQSTDLINSAGGWGVGYLLQHVDQGKQVRVAGHGEVEEGWLPAGPADTTHVCLSASHIMNLHAKTEAPKVHCEYLHFIAITSCAFPASTSLSNPPR